MQFKVIIIAEPELSGKYTQLKPNLSPIRAQDEREMYEKHTRTVPERA